MRKYSYIDIFSGCGGLALGFHNAGWQGLFAVEKSPHAFETLKYNMIDTNKHFTWPNWLTCQHHDINELLSVHSSNLEALKGSIQLIAGGPPCQGFSMAGKRIEEDTRNHLVYSYINFVKKIMPQLILFENVKGFTYAFSKNNPDAKPYSEIVVQELQSLGYNVHHQVINFKDYGVPQSRQRFILVGTLNGSASNFFDIIESEKEHFLSQKGLAVRINVSDAISDLESKNGTVQCKDRPRYNAGIYGSVKSSFQKYMRSGLTHQEDTPDSHSLTHHSLATVELFSSLISNYPQRNKRIENSERTIWNIKKRGITILDPQLPTPTLTTHPDDYIHYSEPRILTVREYARIQTFPDSYYFKGKYTTGGKLRKYEVPRYTQIGNAIPPLFAELAGIALKRMSQDG